LSVSKLPPATTVDPSGETASPLTLPVSARGLQGSSAPSEARNAASRVRTWPPASVKVPPTYTVVLVAAIARTWALTPGANEEMSAPVAALKAAIRKRDCPEMLVKLPPT
jgi:hypothetical protein